MAPLPAAVKWGKQRITGLSLHPSQAADEIMQRLADLTGVPVERQKVGENGGGG